MTLYTISLGFRVWETTNFQEAFNFTKKFGDVDGFKMRSSPYSGEPIDNLICVRQ